MRIAVLNKENCKPKDCNYKCMRLCPINKTGGEAIVVDEKTKKPIISESLCTGCGICPRKCPYSAIHIINLPEELDVPVHQYGQNGFRLYNIPVPREGVVGLVGTNGIGKTTALKILAGELKPNLGEDAGWDQVIDHYRGHEIQEYFQLLSEKNIKAVYKPQYVESIPRMVSGTVQEILEKVDERGELNQITTQLDIQSIMDRDIRVLSGGELQRLALAACILRDADIYLIDEPSSYLDVRERLRMSKAIQSLEKKRVIVVEHDLVVLDYLSEYVHVLFGKNSAYGIVSNIQGVRNGINEYLSGFLTSENMRFREPIKFDVKPASENKQSTEMISYPSFKISLDGFKLNSKKGTINTPEVIGILGPNATGKTTFIKALAGIVKTDPELDLDVKIAYKPQYIEISDKMVMQLKINKDLLTQFKIENLLEKTTRQLSGGELQRVAVADCLSQDADLYLLDEPSAYLDVEQRLSLAKNLGRYAYEHKKSIMVVDHDVLLIDYLSNKIMVFDGKPAKEGVANNPEDLEDGMNHFLKQIKITFRRDNQTGRPRANKKDSAKDREQKENEKYYYS